MWISQQATAIAEEGQLPSKLQGVWQQGLIETPRDFHTSRGVFAPRRCQKDLRAELHVLGRLEIQGFSLFRHIC